MTAPIAATLATSTAARMAAIDALALLAAIVVAVSVLGVLVASLLFDPSAPRPYRFPTALRRSAPLPSAAEDVRHAA